MVDYDYDYGFDSGAIKSTFHALVYIPDFRSQLWPHRCFFLNFVNHRRLGPSFRFERRTKYFYESLNPQYRSLPQRALSWPTRAVLDGSRHKAGGRNRHGLLRGVIRKNTADLSASELHLAVFANTFQSHTFYKRKRLCYQFRVPRSLDMVVAASCDRLFFSRATDLTLTARTILRLWILFFQRGLC